MDSAGHGLLDAIVPHDHQARIFQRPAHLIGTKLRPQKHVVEAVTNECSSVARTACSPKCGTSRQPSIAHVGMNVDILNTWEFGNSLVQLDVGKNSSGKTDLCMPRCLDPMVNQFYYADLK